MSESEQHHASQEQLSEQKDDSRKLFSFYILYLVKLSFGESRKNMAFSDIQEPRKQV